MLHKLMSLCPSHQVAHLPSNTLPCLTHTLSPPNHPSQSRALGRGGVSRVWRPILRGPALWQAAGCGHPASGVPARGGGAGEGGPACTTQEGRRWGSQGRGNRTGGAPRAQGHQEDSEEGVPIALDWSVPASSVWPPARCFPSKSGLNIIRCVHLDRTNAGEGGLATLFKGIKEPFTAMIVSGSAAMSTPMMFSRRGGPPDVVSSSLKPSPMVEFAPSADGFLSWRGFVPDTEVNLSPWSEGRGTRGEGRPAIGHAPSSRRHPLQLRYHHTLEWGGGRSRMTITRDMAPAGELCTPDRTIGEDLRGWVTGGRMRCTLLRVYEFHGCNACCMGKYIA